MAIVSSVYPFLVFFLGNVTIRPTSFVKCLTLYCFFFLREDGSDCVTFLIALPIIWGGCYGGSKGGGDFGASSVTLTFLW